MADLVISPIPTNGGTLSLTNVNSHLCYLGNNRFFALFSQSTPNHLIASTFLVNDFSAASPVLTVAKQRIVGSVAPNRIRCWKLSSNLVLALVGTDLKVFEIGADNDIIVKSASMAGFHSVALWGAESATAMGVGPMIYGKYIADNKVWFIQRATTTAAISFFSITYNPTTDTLTKTIIQTIQSSTTATHLWRYCIKPIPGSNNWLVYAHGGSTTWALSTISKYSVYDESGSLVSEVNTVPTAVKYLVPLGLNKVVGVLTPRTYLLCDGASWSTNAAYFAPTGTSTSVVLDSVSFDTNYFMLASAASTEAGVSSHYFRVSRILDENIGQNLVPGSAANGTSLSTTNTYFDQSYIEVADPLNMTTLIVVGRSSTTAFIVRVMYQV